MSLFSDMNRRNDLLGQRAVAPDQQLLPPPPNIILGGLPPLNIHIAVSAACMLTDDRAYFCRYRLEMSNRGVLL